MDRRRITRFPHCLYFLLPLLLAGWFHFPVAGQQKMKAKDERTFLIDSIYEVAERSGLSADSVLRYEFYFADPDTVVLRKLATRLEQDTFEFISILPAGKAWKLGMTKHLRINRGAMEKLDARLRWLRYSFLADDYLGFTIKPRDPDPLAIDDSMFHAYVSGLPDAELYWVSNRLVQVRSYPKALVALQEGLARNIYPDTMNYQLGTVLVATNEFNDGMEYWDVALRINPDYLEAHMDYAGLLFTNGFFRRALEHYQKADQIKPNDAFILFHIAETLFHLERYNESLAYARRSYSLEKKHVYTKSLIRLLKEPRIRYLRKKELKKQA
jgi:tetratricopeptide (TPR) repeat protein